MKGASGAKVKLNGDEVHKICGDAPQQVEWFERAKGLGLTPGVRLPLVGLESPRSYRMEFVRGHLAASEPSVIFLEQVLSQVMRWRDVSPVSAGDWESYLQRLGEHVDLCLTEEMEQALGLLEAADPFPSSFCHGDLTLENILIESDGTCVLIDPNYKPGLFQSYVLDLGKLLQSTHARYHEVFHSNHGIDLTRHDTWLHSVLEESGLWEQSLLSCISHVIRLRKYRPEEQRPLVDSLLRELITEYERTL